jgi:hypothetical protein
VCDKNRPKRSLLVLRARAVSFLFVASWRFHVSLSKGLAFSSGAQRASAACCNALFDGDR